MSFKNALIYDAENRAFRKSGFSWENGRITGLRETENGVDAEGDLILPGLIDVQTTAAAAMILVPPRWPN